MLLVIGFINLAYESQKFFTSYLFDLLQHSINIIVLYFRLLGKDRTEARDRLLGSDNEDEYNIKIVAPWKASLSHTKRDSLDTSPF